jgi:hydroxymethylbilane synthase
LKSRVLSFGSLGTPLAKSQTQVVIDRLQQVLPRLTCQITVIPSPIEDARKTHEPFLAAAAAEIEHLEDLLIAGEFRLVVVRAADLVLPLRDGVVYAAIPRRDTPFDGLLNRRGLITEELPAGSVIGVLNLAVRSQMQSVWPHLEYRILAGGLDTALERVLRRCEVDGLVLPVSAAEHLGIQGIVTEIFYPEMILPSAGQGILVVLGRENDREVGELLARIHCDATYQEMEAEHAFMQRIASDQELPVGVLARVRQDRLEISGSVSSLHGSRQQRVDLAGPAAAASDVGTRLAESILHDAETLIDLLEADFPDGVPDGVPGGEEDEFLDQESAPPDELDEELRAEIADLDRLSGIESEDD